MSNPNNTPVRPSDLHFEQTSNKNNNSNNNNNENDDFFKTTYTTPTTANTPPTPATVITPLTPAIHDDTNTIGSPEHFQSRGASDEQQEQQQQQHQHQHQYTNPIAVSDNDDNRLNVTSLNIDDIGDVDSAVDYRNKNNQQFIVGTLQPYNHTNSNNNYTSNNGVPQGHYRNTLSQQQPYPQDDKYKLFTIYGNDTDNDKLSGLQRSTTGSLSSIITTSIASSEPDPGRVGSGGGGGGGSGGPDSSSIAGIPGSNDEKQALARPGIKQEKWTTILLQVAIPFFLAGVGTIGAGIILGRVEKWNVFQSVGELFILVPALLGLKGNLDMCLASRLSTQVNLGNTTSRKEVIRMIVGNIALVQVQATVASFLAAMFAVSVGAALDGSFVFEHVMLLIASGMFTATSSCFVLDFVLVAVILLSQKFHLNPDNVATPLAASIGDVVSISLLSFIASMLFKHIQTHLWVTFVVVACYLCLLPLWVVVVLRNKYTRPVLKSGWVPVLSALCISGLGGLVLDAATEVFNGFVVFQPIINGIGGNLVSVQASKISTMLHQSSIMGIIPPHTKVFEWPWKALFKGVPYAKTARILLAMSIPGNIVFIFVADYLHKSESTVTFAFMMSYLVASLLQVMLLLYIAHIIVHAMWKRKIDPDNSSIPYLTALGDLLGSSFLAVAFLFLLSIGKEYDSGMDLINPPN